MWNWLKNLWQYLMTFEPTMLRSTVIAVLALLASLGIVLSPELDNKIDAVVGLVIAILALLQGFWTRMAVVPNAVHDTAVTQALFTPVPMPVEPASPAPPAEVADVDTVTPALVATEASIATPVVVDVQDDGSANPS